MKLVYLLKYNIIVVKYIYDSNHWLIIYCSCANQHRREKKQDELVETCGFSTEWSSSEEDEVEIDKERRVHDLALVEAKKLKDILNDHY